MQLALSEPSRSTPPGWPRHGVELAWEQGISTAHMYARLSSGQVRKYSTADDPLTNIQQNYSTRDIASDGVGSRTYVGRSNLNPAAGHGMANVRSEMEKAYPRFFTR